MDGPPFSDEPIKFPDSEIGHWIHSIREQRRRHPYPPELQFLGLDDLLASPESSSQIWYPKEPSPEYAELYERLLSDQHYCQPKSCFRNAALVALVHPEVEYVEGMSAHIIPIHHAWNLLPDGTIIDCTWCGSGTLVGTPGAEYVGIIVPKEVLRERVNSPEGMDVFSWPNIEDLLINPPDWIFAEPPTVSNMEEDDKPMPVGARPWQILNVPFPERYPEKAPPFIAEIVEAGVTADDILLAVVITSPGVGPEKARLNRWTAIPTWIRRVAAAIAVDMATPLLLEAHDIEWFDINWLSEVIDLAFEHPDGLRGNSEEYLSLDLGHKQLVDHLVKRLGPRETWEPANPTDQVLLAVKNLEVALIHRSARYARNAVKWALRALANVGLPSRTWQREIPAEALEAQETRNRVQFWIDQWWSETLEVIAWDQPKKDVPKGLSGRNFDSFCS